MATVGKNETPTTQPEPAESYSHDLELSRHEFFQLTGGTLLLGVPVGTVRAATRTLAGEISMANVSLNINGTHHTLHIDTRQSLLDLLRETLRLTGTKKGCNQGSCGACTVLLDGKRVNSCLTLAVMHDGASITTIEGLSNGEELHPLQVAFIEHDGFQCGYCTSGQIVSGVGCIAEGHARSPDDIKFWMSGNICRCGAYPGIVAAIDQVAKGEAQ
jgi:xanthine dehydrogenase YagT iron-sulfur-binding subunit